MLLVTLILMAISAYVGFETGRRWTAGRKEIAAEKREEERFLRGRRGTVKLKSMKIRR
jgi:hypothetical protein